MLFDGIKLVEGSEVQNLVVDTGSSFPATPNEGELFYRNDGSNEGLYVYNGTAWNRQVNSGDSFDVLLPDSVTPGTYTSVTISAKGLVTAGSNPTTLTGYGITDAQPLDGDLTAIANISATSGLLKKTASNTWTLDTNTYITGNQTITASGDVTGSGSTSITLTLATTGVAAGAYGTASSVPSISIDSKGRITTASNTPIAIDTSAVTSGTFASARISQASVTQHQAALTILESQITDGTLLARNAGNETISGNWTFNNVVVGVTPTLDSHFATKSYVDNVAAGVNPHKSVVAATTGNITLSGPQTIDGVSVVAGNRVLVKDQSTASQNGIYDVNASTWTRSSDFDGSPTNEVATGDLVYVESGTTNGNSSWILVTTGTISLGSTALTFSLFSRPGDLIAGAGLTKTGSTFDVGTASTSRIVVNADNIDLATTGISAGTYAQVTVDVYGRATSGSSTLPFSSLTGTPTTLSGYGITDAQPLDSDLTAVAGLATSGLIVRTGTGTATTRTITVSGTGISITNGDGISGNPTITSNATSTNVASTLVARDASGNFTAGTITAALTGNASTATALETSRSISASGDASWTVNFDGSANATAALTLATVNSNVGSFGSSTLVPIITVNAKGLITAVSTTSISSTATSANNIIGGAAGSVPYQTGSGATSFIAAGTSSQVLISGTTPSWTNTPTLTGTNFTGIPNSGLTNSTITVGSTAIALGSSATTIAGLTSVTSTSFMGALTGNASTATILQTARTINGVSFDGSSNITVTAAAGTLTGTTLNSTVVSSSLTSVGTLTTLTTSGLATLGAGVTQKQVAMGALNIDLATGSYFSKTITGISTITVSNTASSGNVSSFILDLTNGGAFAITWGFSPKWASGTAPTLTASGRDVLGFFTYDGGTTWNGFVLGKAMA